MKVFIFGDANVDVTVKWRDVEDRLDELPGQYMDIVSKNMEISRKSGEDLECYLPERPYEMSKFINSLNPRIEFGGCGAIKARTMAMLGHEVLFYSWVGNDDKGRLVLDELKKAGVDTSNVEVLDEETCETFNLFDPEEERLAFSYWEPKLDLAKFTSDAKEQNADKIFLTGGHRIKDPLGYSKLQEAYVFTGSFTTYDKEELKRKYEADFSKGILVGNEAEIMLLSEAKGVISGMESLMNDIVVMHGPDVTAVKRGNGIIRADVPPADRSKAKELTGLGDVWEAFFLSAVDNIDAASEEEIKEAMELASRAAVHRMMTGEFPGETS